MPPVAAEPSSDSEVEANDDDEYGVQNREISNNECAVCFGLYQDDLSTTEKWMREWVECTNEGARSGCTASVYKMILACMCVECAIVDLAN